MHEGDRTATAQGVDTLLPQLAAFCIYLSIGHRTPPAESQLSTVTLAPVPPREAARVPCPGDRRLREDSLECPRFGPHSCTLKVAATTSEWPCSGTHDT